MYLSAVYHDIYCVLVVSNKCKQRSKFLHFIIVNWAPQIPRNKYCGILIGDTRRKKFYIHLAYRVMTIFLDTGFKLKEDIIKHQWNCKTTPFWTKKSKEYNFLLIMHEHLFVFKML